MSESKSLTSQIGLQLLAYTWNNNDWISVRPVNIDRTKTTRLGVLIVGAVLVADYVTFAKAPLYPAGQVIVVPDVFRATFLSLECWWFFSDIEMEIVVSGNFSEE